MSLLHNKHAYKREGYKKKDKKYSHIAKRECQIVNGCVYLAKNCIFVFLINFVDVQACGKQ